MHLLFVFYRKNVINPWILLISQLIIINWTIDYSPNISKDSFFSFHKILVFLII
jgi:hypothetical protein